MPSRRRFLSALGVATLSGFAGCTTSADSPPPPETPPLEPERHIYGADGNWSSFGCNAGNTRSVHGIDNGEAPVDGVSEDWRVPVTDLQRNPPVVADGRVYLSTGSGLEVYDTSDGSELWQTEGISDAPVVYNETVYVADDEANTVRALSVETGEEQWTLETEGSPVGPSLYPGTPLIVGVDEGVFGLNPETGEPVWSRDLFGTVIAHPPVWNGFAAAVATDAGEVSLLSLREGTGLQRFELPATPIAPPSADTDSVYVSCRNGTTYALQTGDSATGQQRWAVDTGWSPGGLGIDSGLVLAGSAQSLHAIESDSGTVRWTHPIGEWRHTAPAIGRETIFIGGDRLWALDPTPDEGVFGSAPAVRYEKTFYGRVGPGPVLDDGILYVVAKTGEESTHLLALS